MNIQQKNSLLQFLINLILLYLKVYVNITSVVPSWEFLYWSLAGELYFAMKPQLYQVNLQHITEEISNFTKDNVELAEIHLGTEDQ